MLIGGLIIVAIALYSLSTRNTEEKVMNEFCKIDCKKSIQSKYQFCC